MSNLAPNERSEPQTRKARLSLLAKAPAQRLSALWLEWLEGADAPEHSLLRGPELGAVMVRARAGAVGAPFNLGEMTVARCSVRLASGAVGHGHVQGRDKAAAKIAALIDALCEDGQAEALEAAILAPLRAEAEAGKAARASKAAATKVEFFTMVRGES